MLSFCVLWVFGDCISNDSRWHLLSLFPKCWAGPADAAAAQPGVNWWLMEWGYLIRLPKNTYKYILLYPAHMFLTVGMTLGIRVPVVGPLKDINFQKHSGAPLAVLVYIYISWFLGSVWYQGGRITGERWRRALERQGTESFRLGSRSKPLLCGDYQSQSLFLETIPVWHTLWPKNDRTLLVPRVASVGYGPFQAPLARRRDGSGAFCLDHRQVERRESIWSPGTILIWGVPISIILYIYISDIDRYCKCEFFFPPRFIEDGGPKTHRFRTAILTHPMWEPRRTSTRTMGLTQGAVEYRDHPMGLSGVDHPIDPRHVDLFAKNQWHQWPPAPYLQSRWGCVKSLGPRFSPSIYSENQ